MGTLNMSEMKITKLHTFEKREVLLFILLYNNGMEISLQDGIDLCDELGKNGYISENNLLVYLGKDIPEEFQKKVTTDTKETQPEKAFELENGEEYWLARLKSGGKEQEEYK